MTDGAKPSCKEKAAKLIGIAKSSSRLDLAAIREKLSKATGPTYWRSLEELAEEPGFDDVMHREFPRLASEWPEGCSRRDFLRLAGASLALAGLAGCTKQPLEPIVPYVVQPERIVLGRPLYFATAFPVSGIARPIIVKSVEGRPIKVEGNPQHGASLGAADAHSQAAVLGLYDPDRSQTISYKGSVRPWGTLQANIRAALAQQQASGGAGLRILTETVSSPTLASQSDDALMSQRASPRQRRKLAQAVPERAIGDGSQRIQCCCSCQRCANDCRLRDRSVVVQAFRYRHCEGLRRRAEAPCQGAAVASNGGPLTREEEQYAPANPGADVDARSKGACSETTSESG